MRQSSYTLALLFAFLLLSLILTFPLITQITTHVPGSELWAFDEYTFVWNIWWFKHALLQLNQSPLASDFIFYPVGVNLALYTYTLFNAALALPLVPWLPLPLVSNLVTLFAFVVSAYGAYLLMKFLISACRFGFQIGTDNPKSKIKNFYPEPAEGLKSEMAALAAGIAYAFTTSKFVYAAIGHYDMVGTEWIPFFVLYFLKAMNCPARVNSRSSLLAGLFLALSMYVEMIFGVFLVFLMLIYLLVVKPWRRMAWRTVVIQLTLMGLFASLIYLPVLLPVLNELFNADYTLKGWGDAQKLSVDLLGFVSPSALSTWAGLDWNRELVNVAQGQSRFSDVNTVFLGYATLALALVGLIANWRAVKVWGIGALVFALFALGPLLQINGQSLFDLDGLKVNLPLPFIALHYIPIVQANRVPNRLSVVLVLCLAVLVGYGVWWVQRKLAERREIREIRGDMGKSPLSPLFLLIALLLLIDHLAIPLPMTDARVPTFYSQLAQDLDDYAILQLPLGWRNSFGTLGAEDTRVQYYQSIHHKRILGGNTSRNHPFKFDYFASLPIVSSLITIEDYKKVTAEQRDFDRAFADEFIRFFDLRYVVVHPAVPGRQPYADTRAAALQYLLDVLPLEPVNNSDELLVYRVKPAAVQNDLVIDFGEPASRLYRGEGWDREEEISGVRANWASARRARVLLPVSALADHRLSFAALPFIFPNAPQQTITIVVNQRLRLPPINLAPSWHTYELDVPASALTAGLNEFTFEFAYTRAPRDVLQRTPEMIASGTQFDPRPLAVAVDWLRWQRR